MQKEVFYLLLLFAGSLSNRLFYYQQFLFAKYIKIRKNILAALSEAFVEIEGSHYKHNQYLVLLLGNNADKLTWLEKMNCTGVILVVSKRKKVINESKEMEQESSM